MLSKSRKSIVPKSGRRSIRAGVFLIGLIILTLTATRALALDVDLSYSVDRTIDDQGNPLRGLAGCEVNIGTKSGVYSSKIQSPDCQSVTVTDLDPHQTYYFSVVAKSLDGNLSGPSPEVVFNGSAETSPNDFDGDGLTDLAFVAYKPQAQPTKNSTGKSAQKQKKVKKAIFTGVNSSDEHLFEFILGSAGSMPAQADYDGDGRTDFAVVSPGSVNSWSVQLSSSSKIVTKKFGRAGETMIAGCDFDGDHKADMAALKGRTLIAKGLVSGKAQKITLALKKAFKVASCADLNGDGSSELVVTSAQGSKDWLIAVNRQGQQVVRKLIDRSTKIIAADLNGDSLNELAFVSRSTSGKYTLSFLVQGQELPVAVEIDAPKDLSEARLTTNSFANDSLLIHAQAGQLKELSLSALSIIDRNVVTSGRKLLNRFNAGKVSPLSTVAIATKSK